MIVTHPRLDVLADALADILKDAPGSLLQPETIVVPNRAVFDWLIAHLTDRLGAVGNLYPATPRQIAEQILTALEGGAPVVDPFTPEAMTWHLYRILGDADGDDPEQSTSADLDNPAGPILRFRLARHLANEFDTRLLYRPETIERWESTETPDPLATYWRKLRATFPNFPHLASLQAKWRSPDTPVTQLEGLLPPRLICFGLRGLPPWYLHLLSLASDQIPMVGFFPTPSTSWWNLQRNLEGLEAEQPLLTRWGRRARDWLEQVDQQPRWPVNPLPEPISQDSSVLARLQDSIQSNQAMLPQAPDESLHFHLATTAQAEVEAAHNLVLHLLETTPDLAPEDIQLVAPDLDAYLPLIDRSFGLPPHPEASLPLSRPFPDPQAQESLALAVQDLLGILDGPANVDDLSAWLDRPAVGTALQLAGPSWDRLRPRLRDLGLAGGLNVEPPEMARHSWPQTIDRLIAGCLLAPDTTNANQQRPIPIGDGPEVLTNLLRLRATIRRLAQAAGNHRTDRSPAVWSEWIHQLGTDLFGEAFGQDRLARHWETELAQISTTGFTEVISFDVLKEWIQDDPTSAPNLRDRGGIVVAGLRLAAALPCRVRIVLGLAEGSFPRPANRREDDPIRKQPRPGDPRPDDEDRDTALDLVLQTQDQLHCFWSGPPPSPDGLPPPSAILRDLADALQREWPEKADDLPRPGFSQHGSLRASEAWPSYRDLRDTPTKSTEPTRIETIPSPEPPKGPEANAVDLAELHRWLRHPARYRLARDYGINSRQASDWPPTDPRYEKPRGLWGSMVEQALRAAPSTSPTHAINEGSEIIPLPPEGPRLLEELQDAETAWELFRRAKQLDQHPHPQAVSVEAGDCTLSGWIEVYGEGTLVRRRATGSLRTSDHLSACLDHLIWQSAYPESAVPSYLWTASRVVTLKPHPEAGTLLRALVDWLQADTAAAILPRTLWELGKPPSRTQKKTPAEILDDTRSKFRRAGQRGEDGGEGADPEVALWMQVHGQQEDWDELADIAERVFRPFHELSAR